MNQKQVKANPAALLPIGVFLMIFLGSGMITGDFYAMPTVVGFMIALLVAFCQNRGLSFEEKISVISRGVGNENIITMCLIFLCAGAFSGAVTAAGGVDSTVNLGLSIMPPSVAVAGLFVIGCFISTSMGTSVGTVTALTPIAVGISEKTGLAMALCVGAALCGAMFGDNLSMISDTTIAAVKTQGCEMKDKFKENFFIVLPAAIVTFILFLVLAMNGQAAVQSDLSYDILKVIPYFLVLAGALVGINVFIVLITGIVTSLAVGVFTGTIAPDQIFVVMGDGVMSMYDITVISILVACMVSLIKAYGGIQFILDKLRSTIRSQKGAELGIAGLSLLVDVCTANNTVAIVMAGPIAKEICDEFDVDPKRSASLLDIFSSVGQGMIPYGAQLLTAATLAGLTPYDIMPYLFYPMLMAVSALLFIFFRKRVK